MDRSYKEMLFGEEARSALALGVGEVADAVAFTLGPLGRGIGLEKEEAPLSLSTEGFRIAESVRLEDPFAQMGVEIAQKLALSLKKEQGDGITTALLCLRALVEKRKNSSPLAICESFDAGLAHILNALEKESRPLQDEIALRQVAATAIWGDSPMCSFLAACLASSKADDLLLVEEHARPSTKMSPFGALSFEAAPLFYPLASEAPLPQEKEEPFLFLSSRPLLFPLPLLPLLKYAADQGRPLLLLAPSFGEDVLSTLGFHNLRGSLSATALQINKKQTEIPPFLEDLSVVSGAQEASSDSSWDTFLPGVLGSVKRARIEEKSVHLLYKPKKRVLQAHLKTLSPSDPLFEKRCSFFAKRGALLSIGGLTEEERKVKKRHLTSALQAMRSSQKEGAVLGGGAALFHAGRSLSTVSWPKEWQAGIALLQKAAEAPLRQIIANAGHDANQHLQEVGKRGSPFGFHSFTEETEDLFAAGVLDPLAFVKNTFRNAVEAAKTVWLSETLIGPLR